MIQFKYKNFGEEPQAKPQSKGPGMGAKALGVGFAGLTGYGMISSSRGHKESMSQGIQGLEEQNRQTAVINRNLDQLEKSFGLPALLAGTGGMIAMTAAPMVQSSMQMGDQKQMNEDQVAAQDRQTQAIQRQNALLQRIEQRGGTPQQAAMVTRKNFSVLGERQYAVNLAGVKTWGGKVWKGMGKIFKRGKGKAVPTPPVAPPTPTPTPTSTGNGFVQGVKDLWNAGKEGGLGKGMKSNVLFGLGMAGAAYGVNKYISNDMKKSGLDVDSDGNLIQKGKAYSETQQVVGQVENAAKKKGEGVMGKIMGPGLVALFEAPRIIGYHQEKRQLKNQIAGTGGSVMQQKSYAELDDQGSNSGLKTAVGIGAGILGTAALGTYAGHRGWLGKTIKNKAYFQHPGRTLTGFANVMGSYGTINKDVMAKTSESLQKNSKTKAMRNFGKWAGKHKTLANLVALGPGIALGAGTFALGEKGVRKTTEAIDPESYKYQNAKDKKALQQ